MKKIILSLMIIVVSFLFSQTVYGSMELSEKGIMTVTHMDIEEKITLDGKWEFYWEELLTPQDFHLKKSEPSFIEVPSPWRNQIINEESLPRYGYGTYRLRVKISSEDVGKEKALRLNYIGSAYRLWIDGKELASLGNVGKNKNEEVFHLQKKLIIFEPENEIVEMVLQVSNFSFRDGGILNEIEFGDADTISRNVLQKAFFTVFIIGSSFIIGAYHILIFIIRKKEKPILFIGLFSLAISVRAFLISESIINILFPKANWELVIKGEYIGEIAGFIFLVLLFKSIYPHEVHKKMVHISYFIACIFSLFIMVTPTEIFTQMLPYHLPVMIGIMLYFIFVVGTMAMIRKRAGSLLNLLGGLVLILASINDYLVSLMIIKSFHMLEFAFIIFTVLQAVIISNYYARLNQDNERLATELSELNTTLAEKIEERTVELHDKNQELERLQKTRTKLLANIAHGIGTPIIGVQTYLQIMKEGKISLDMKAVLPQLMDKLSYIQKLNSDLLELSKLESLQLSFHFETVKAGPFFDEIFQSFVSDTNEETIAIHPGRFETKIHGKEVLITIDKWRIRQVIQNYVENAKKFTGEDDTVITLHCYPRKGELGDELVMEVEDHGRGINPEELPYVFERFYKKWEGNVVGSGLGLAIVKEIIERHDGKVGVRSTLGQGSTFSFTLPVKLEGQ